MSTSKKLIAATSGTAGGGGLNVEQVFATNLYTGTGSSRSRTNYIDLAGEGGLVWFKRRNGQHEHGLYDTARGTGKRLMTDQTGAEETDSNGLSAFGSSGFTVVSADDCNGNSDTYASWTFRKAPKFFDVVTYTGNGTAGRQIAHNLGTTVGMLVVKRLDSTGDWSVFHRKLNNGTNSGNYRLELQSTGDEGSTPHWNNTVPSSTTFTVGSSNTVNGSGHSYVAYLWAHNNSDGGFGPNEDLDIIKCGSFNTSTGSGLVGPNLGFEPQWVMFKNATSTQSGDWWIMDTHRGFYGTGYDSNTGKTRYLRANSSNEEANFSNNTLNITSTGFTIPSDAFSESQTFIYVAIRRAPTAEAIEGNQVFEVQGGGSTSYTPYFQYDSSSKYAAYESPDDLSIYKRRDDTSPADLQWGVADRIRGLEPWTSFSTTSHTTTPTLHTHSTDGETTSSVSQIGKYPGTTGLSGGNPAATLFLANQGSNQGTYVRYTWRRSPGFFDIVSYHGDGNTTQTITHNLQGIPKMIWAKRRDGLSSGTGSDWVVYYGSGLYNVFLNSETNYTGLLAMHKTGSAGSAIDSTYQFDVRIQSGGNAAKSLNTSGEEYVLYIFGEQTGISKIGTYSGTGSDVDVDCGFSNGARFVLIKNVSAGTSGPWYAVDTLRGIVAGNDPYHRFNDTSVEQTIVDLVDPLNAGFTVTPNGGSATNSSGDTYLFYAIA
jgi:hypothetical protein